MKKNLFVLVVVLMSVMVGCGSKPTLSRWLDSDDVATVEEQINTAYAEANLGLRIKFSADSEDVLVFSYIYEQYENLAGLNQSEILNLTRYHGRIFRRLLPPSDQLCMVYPWHTA